MRFFENKCYRALCRHNWQYCDNSLGVTLGEAVEAARAAGVLSDFVFDLRRYGSILGACEEWDIDVTSRR